MDRPIGTALRLASCAATIALAGCTGPHPFVQEGNATSVEIGYSGDVATAWPLARQHCAAYERVPRLVDPDFDTALFHCIHP